MQRRNFLKTALATPLFLSFPSWEGKGREVLLSNYVRHALHSQVEPSKQVSIDCVSHAASLGVDFVQAIQHFLSGDTWYGRISSEAIHAGTVLKICPETRGDCNCRNCRRMKKDPLNSGITIKEGVLFLQQYGNLLRRVYGDIDLTKYDWKNCKRLYQNFSEELLTECKKHPIQTATNVTTWEEAKTAIYNLQPVVIGSDIGFDGASRDNKAERDSDGFAQPKGKWYHAWLLIGIRDRGRKGGCLISSHGKNWVNGPKSPGQPDGSIWVDKPILHKMLSKYGDSYAISDFR